MKRLNVLLIIFLLISLGCEQVTENTTSSNEGGWLINKDQVYDGGPGRDGIPSIDNPKFDEASTINYLDDKDLVVGIRVNGEIKAYPHPILNWHEIVNDEVGGEKIAITYCPLTGSALAWSRKVNGETTTFGVSGLLYNNNLIPYDRKTESNWSQMLVQGISGEMKGTAPKTYSVVETTWQYWKRLYPNSKVLTKETGYTRKYNIYPYGDYKSNHDKLLFPVTNQDNRLENKQRVLGVLIGGEKKAYALNSSSSSTFVTTDEIGGKQIVVAGNPALNFIVAFERRLNDGTLLNFNTVDKSNKIILEDNEGNQWDIFGKAVSGPRTGTKLNKPQSYIAYWFAWAAFYPGTGVRKGGDF